MPIRIYNTLSRQVETFVPHTPGRVGMYLCGPTVYDDCHIGHLMGPVLFDSVARWFAARGFVVRFVNNITDIDDKIINLHLKTGEPWQAITKRYTAQYLGLLQRLHVTTITDRPTCTGYVTQMVQYIGELIAKDRAYVVPDGVAYDVAKQPAYGKLSGRKLDEMISGSRVERDSGLRHPADFALWKHAKPGEPVWDSPWGQGRPGWHIECSVMSCHTLGASFDIHAGGEDLKFPHHENEIAQGEAHGGTYARYWMHNNLVQFEGQKISKSDPRMKDPAFGDQFKALRVVDRFGAPAIRLLLLSGHYRRPVDFGPQAITAIRTSLGRLLAALAPVVEEPGEPRLEELLVRPCTEAVAKIRAAFTEAMDEDFNTGAALAQIHSLLAEARKLPEVERPAALRLARDLGRLLGLFQPGDAAAHAKAEESGTVPAGDGALDQVMSLVLELRQKARAARDFATSDLIRDRLKAAGITVKDAKDGASWERGPVVR